MNIEPPDLPKSTMAKPKPEQIATLEIVNGASATFAQKCSDA